MSSENPTLPDNERAILYNRFHVAKHRAKKAGMSFAWDTVDEYIDAILAKVEGEYSAETHMAKFDPDALHVYGMCEKSLRVVPYGSDGDKPKKRRRKAAKPKTREKQTHDLSSSEDSDMLCFVSAQLTTILQEVDGEIDSLLSMAQEAAQAAKQS